MKTNEEVKAYIEAAGYDEVIIFENPDYASAFIGLSSDDRAIYDYERMVEHLMTEEGMDEEEARDFISYNTLRSLPYITKGPVVIHPIDSVL